MGSPVAFKAGRRVLLVSYVSVGEWEAFGELLEQDEAQAVLELIYYSLHRANPALKRRSVRRWVRWHRKLLSSLVNLICTISLPKAPKNAAPAIAVKEAERAMNTAFRVLSRMHGWTPADISGMSSAQIHLYLSGGEDGTGIRKMSGAEYKSFRAQRGVHSGGLN